jgi:hypothetical protein
MTFAAKLQVKECLMRVFENVARGFSLVLHDPEGSHYRI